MAGTLKGYIFDREILKFWTYRNNDVRVLPSSAMYCLPLVIGVVQQAVQAMCRCQHP